MEQIEESKGAGQEKLKLLEEYRKQVCRGFSLFERLGQKRDL
jgi:hypothetical protein